MIARADPTATATPATTAQQATSNDPPPPAAPLDASPTAVPDNGDGATSPESDSDNATSGEADPPANPAPQVAEAAATPTPIPPAPTVARVQPTVAPPPPPPPPTSTPVPPPPPPPAAPVGLTGLEQEMFTSHNATRSQSGLAALTLNGTLVNVARQRAQDMAASNYFSHTSPNGSTAFSLLGATGYPFAVAGENIARNNYPNAQSVGVAMTGFMNSSGHRANILDGRYTSVGIGSAIGADGMKYFAVIFAGQ